MRGHGARCVLLQAADSARATGGQGGLCSICMEALTGYKDWCAQAARED